MTDQASENLLLAGLSNHAYGRIADELKPVSLPLGRIVIPPEDMPDHFYFITAGLVSLLHENSDGQSTEIALVGREAGIGLPIVLGRRAFPTQAIVQVAGSALTLPANRMRQEFDLVPADGLRLRILQYVQVLMTQMAQTAVCNRHHSVEAQLIRWVLLSLDRLSTNQLTMTQEMIANMLGVRRAGVSEAIGRLEREGVVKHRRGNITVEDEAALRERACECYHVIRSEYRHLEQQLLQRGRREGLPGSDWEPASA